MAQVKQQQAGRMGEAAWARMVKVNSELFTLTYGAMVAQLLNDLEDVDAVNTALYQMGHNIGIRIIDEFLAKSGASSCQSFRDTADMIARVAFRMFLGVTADVTSWNNEGTAFSIVIGDNPFIEFVELPAQYQSLKYCNLLCGVIAGSLEMIQMQVECRSVKDMLHGDDTNEIRVELKSMLAGGMLDDYKET